VVNLKLPTSTESEDIEEKCYFFLLGSFFPARLFCFSRLQIVPSCFLVDGQEFMDWLPCGGGHAGPRSGRLAVRRVRLIGAERFPSVQRSSSSTGEKIDATTFFI